MDEQSRDTAVAIEEPGGLSSSLKSNTSAGVEHKALRVAQAQSPPFSRRDILQRRRSVSLLQVYRPKKRNAGCITHTAVDVRMTEASKYEAHIS